MNDSPFTKKKKESQFFLCFLPLCDPVGTCIDSCLLRHSVSSIGESWFSSKKEKV